MTANETPPEPVLIEAHQEFVVEEGPTRGRILARVSTTGFQAHGVKETASFAVVSLQLLGQVPMMLGAGNQKADHKLPMPEEIAISVYGDQDIAAFTDALRFLAETLEGAGFHRGKP